MQQDEIIADSGFQEENNLVDSALESPENNENDTINNQDLSENKSDTNKEKNKAYVDIKTLDEDKPHTNEDKEEKIIENQNNFTEEDALQKIMQNQELIKKIATDYLSSDNKMVMGMLAEKEFVKNLPQEIYSRFYETMSGNGYIKQRAVADEEIKSVIITDYLHKLSKAEVPRTINGVSGPIAYSGVRQPKTLKEAGDMAKRMFYGG